MNVKVHCPCTARFAFEVEPEDGRMPISIFCPDCGADSTELANAVIAAQLAAAASVETRPKLSLKLSAPPPAPVAPSALEAAAKPAGGGLRLSRPAETHAAPPAPVEGGPPAEETAARGLFCGRHTQVAHESCLVCGKPICPACMGLTGYVCSSYCETQAEARGLAVPVYAGQRRNQVRREARGFKKGLAWAAVGVALLVASWGWYVFSGSRPKQFFARKIEEDAMVRLVAPDRYAVLGGKTVSVFDLAQNRELWSVDVPTAPEQTQGPNLTADERAMLQEFEKAGGTPGAATPAAGAESGQPAAAVSDQDKSERLKREEKELARYRRRMFQTQNYSMFLAGGDLWVVAPGKLMRLDPATGATKLDHPLEGVGDPCHVNEWCATLRLRQRSGAERITQVLLDTGELKSFDAPAPPGGRQGRFMDYGNVYAAGGHALTADFKLVKRITLEREAMKKPAANALAETGRISVGNSLQAAQEMFNDMQRDTGETTVRQDASQWAVTLERPGTGAPVWKGEVIGNPGVITLRDVDVVTGGKEIHVFDKQNRKLWDAKLSFSLTGGGFSSLYAMAFARRETSPVFVHAGTLYVFDRGMLSAFEMATGNARWRLPTAGVTQVEVGDDGKLYVATTTATPDMVRFELQVNLMEKPRPVIMKVDPRNGRILWQHENRGPDLEISGKFILAGAATTGGFAAALHDQPERSHYNIHRLAAGSGKTLWSMYQPGHPVRIENYGRRFLLVYEDEVRAFKFLSF